MAEQTTIPEPPDGAHVLLGEAPLQVLVVRDDQSAAEMRESKPGWRPEEFRWWRSDDGDGDPLLWSEIADPAAEPPGLPRGLDRTVVERLFTAAELDQAVADGGYEDIGEHRIALGSGRCVTHGETYEVPVELERLREREGGGSGG